MPYIESPSLRCSLSQLSLQDSFKDHSIPSTDMSLKKRIQSLSPAGRRQRKLSQDSVTSSKQQEHAKRSAKAMPDSNHAEGLSTVYRIPPDSPSKEFARKSDRVQHWLGIQAQRLNHIKLGYRRHRDSMFNKEDIEKELKLRSKDANAEILGPDGRPIDERVIERFFERYPACESGWSDSARWERFQANCLIELRAEDHFRMLYPCYGAAWKTSSLWQAHKMECLEQQCPWCVSSRLSKKRSSSPLRKSSSSWTRSTSPRSRKLPRKTSLFENLSIFSLSKWRSRSPPPENKGKRPATEEEASLLLTQVVTKPITELEDTSLPVPRDLSIRPRPNAVLAKRIQHVQQKPILYSGTTKVLDPKQIHVPAITDLKPADSSAFNPADLSHMTGRPYSPCPLEEGRLPFPLSKKALPAPEVQDDYCIPAIPEHLLLRAPSPASSDDGVFAMSPLSSPNSSTTNLRHHESTIRLVNAQANNVGIQNLLDDLGREVAMPTIRRRRAMPARVYPRPRTTVVFPPTPPASRPGSGSYGSSRGSSRGSSNGNGRTADQRFTAYANALAPIAKSRAELRAAHGRYVAVEAGTETVGLGRRRAVRHN